MGKDVGGGRPTLLDNPATFERLRQGFLESGHLFGAARRAGVHPSTISTWRNQGRQDIADEKPNTPHARAHLTLEDAKSELIAELSAQAQAIAIRDQDFKAIMRLLSSLDPDSFSETKRLRHGGDSGAPPIATTNIPPVQILQVTLADGLEAEIIATLDDDGELL